MEKKTFNQMKEDKVEMAEIIVEEAEAGNVTIPQLKQMKEFLEDPYESTKKEVKNIADMAASIYEVGLLPSTPEVKNWAKKELGMSSTEFGEILENSNTEEEVKINLLKEIDTPKEIIAEVKEENSGKKR